MCSSSTGDRRRVNRSEGISRDELFIITCCAFFRLWKPFHKRKNYLFAGSDAGRARAAAIYSLLGSAKLNGCNPEAYLREVLTCIADYQITRIAELLPWNLPTTESTQLADNGATLALPA